MDGRNRDLFAFRINHIDLLSFTSAFKKNAAFLEHFIQIVLFFTRHPGDERLVGTRSQRGNKQMRFFLSFFSFREESVPSVSLNAFSRVPAASSLAPLLVASSCFANFCLNSGRKDAALSLVGLY